LQNSGYQVSRFARFDQINQSQKRNYCDVKVHVSSSRVVKVCDVAWVSYLSVYLKKLQQNQQGIVMARQIMNLYAQVSCDPKWPFAYSCDCREESLNTKCFGKIKRHRLQAIDIIVKN